MSEAYQPDQQPEPTENDGYIEPAHPGEGPDTMENPNQTVEPAHPGEGPDIQESPESQPPTQNEEKTQPESDVNSRQSSEESIETAHPEEGPDTIEQPTESTTSTTLIVPAHPEKGPDVVEQPITTTTPQITESVNDIDGAESITEVPAQPKADELAETGFDPITGAALAASAVISGALLRLRNKRK